MNRKTRCVAHPLRVLVGAVVAALAACSHEEPTPVSPAIVTAPQSVATTESGPDVPFQVSLAVAPSSSVSILVTSSDETEGLVTIPGSGAANATATLTFEPATWNVPQAVAIRPVDDPTPDGSVTYDVSLSVSSTADPRYQSVAPVRVSVTNADDEAAIDIRGVVVSDQQAPVAGAIVGIPGYGSTTTASDGTFSFAGVFPPYDIGISMPSSGLAVFYKSIRNTTPRLPFHFAPGAKRTAYVSGTVTGGEGYPQPANHYTDVCLDADTNFGAPGSNAPPPGAPANFYGAGLSWGSTPTISATLQGIQYVVDGVTGSTTSYIAYGHVDALTLTAEATTTDQVLPLDPVATATLTGTVTLPQGYAVSFRSLKLGCLGLVSDAATDTSFSYATPNVSGAGLALRVSAQDGTDEVSTFRSGLPPDATAVTVDMPSAATPSSPVDGATMVDAGTVFSWSELAGATYVLLLRHTSGDRLLLVFTSDPSTALPDPALVGVPIPRSTMLMWEVGAVVPLAMDDIVQRGSFEPASDWSETISGARYLMTAP